MRKKKLTAAEKLIASARSEIESKSKPKIDKKKYFYNLPINEQYEQIKESKKINLTKGADQDNFEDILKEQLFKEEIEARNKALEDKEESEYFADESDDTKKMLNAAAFTYVASFIAMAAQIFRLISLNNTSPSIEADNPSIFKI